MLLNFLMWLCPLVGFPTNDTAIVVMVGGVAVGVFTGVMAARILSFLITFVIGFVVAVVK